MRIHLIRELWSIPVDHPRLSGLHNFLFHGTATRGGRDLIDSPVTFLTTDARIPLEITRSGTSISDIFTADGNFVVSERVKETISEYAHIEFLPVRFKKLFEWDFKAGDFSFYSKSDEFRLRDYRPIARKKPDVPAFHELIGSYYEVLVPRTLDLTNEYPDMSTIDVELGDLVMGPVEVLCERAQFLKYAILWSGAFLLREDVFAIFDRYIDWEYYLTTTISI